ncbi:MAG: hypothetical protein AAB706_01125 [Patescibacteria group bacterium]
MSESLSPNRDAFILFEAIQQAFDQSHFIHNLSGCARLLLTRSANDKAVPWEHYDDIFDKTLGGFHDALILAVKQGKVEYIQEKEECLLNDLLLPPTFVQWARTVKV